MHPEQGNYYALGAIAIYVAFIAMLIGVGING